MSLCYRAFGQRLESDIELPLLSPCEKTRPFESSERFPPTGISASIRVSDDALLVREPSIGGSDDTTFTMFREGSSVLMALNRTGWLARFNEGSVDITLHPDARVQDTSVARESRFSRVLGDRVVTSVVPFIPQLWGLIAVHGALLSSPAGGVLLVGKSGAGKSTLSQVLRRDFGWHVLDDDTSMVVSDGENIRLLPMGAKARLKRDAAEFLELPIEPLPGHGGGKGALRADSRPQPLEMGVTLSHTFSLASDQEPGAAPADISVEQIEQVRALSALYESLFGLWPDRKEPIKELFRVSAELASVKSFSLAFSSGSHSPLDVARMVGQAVKLALRSS